MLRDFFHGQLRRRIRPVKRLRLLLLFLAPLFFLAPALTIAQAPAPIQVQDAKSQTVYVTRTGKKYHRDGCRYLSQEQVSHDAEGREGERLRAV